MCVSRVCLLSFLVVAEEGESIAAQLENRATARYCFLFVQRRFQDCPQYPAGIRLLALLPLTIIVFLSFQRMGNQPSAVEVQGCVSPVYKET